MRERLFRNFLGDPRGSASVEFVVVFLGFIAIILFVVEVSLYMFFTASIEKAAEAGARAVAVSPRIIGSVPALNEPNGTRNGEACGTTGCARWNKRDCGPPPDSLCSGATFNRVLAHMQGFNGRIRRQNVEVTYTYTGIGFAGGPSVPMITVTVKNVPFETGILGLLLRSTEDVPILDDLRTLPPRSASMTGEDMAL